jgi:bifunctional DNase/RNase
MTHLLICRLTHCPGHDKAIVMLEGVDQQLELALLIPVNEAYCLARVLGLARCSYVPVLELIDGLLAHFNTRVLRVVLDGEEAGVSATLYLGENHHETALPCHLADALALAERTHAPIYATDDVLSYARQLGQRHSRGTGHPDSARYLERTRPEDFHSPWRDRH